MRDFKLTAVDRNGDRFKASFESKGWVREVSGTVSGSQVSRKAKDVRVIRGGAGGDNQGSIVSDDRAWMNEKKKEQFKGNKEANGLILQKDRKS